MQCLQTNLCCVVTLVAILFGACVFIYVKMPRDQNKNLTDEQRRDMLWFLQQRASAENKNGLKRNAMKDAAIHFECTAKCVQRIWKRAQVNRGKVESKIKGTSGRKRIDRTHSLAAMRNVPVKQRYF